MATQFPHGDSIGSVVALKPFEPRLGDRIETPGAKLAAILRSLEGGWVALNVWTDNRPSGAWYEASGTITRLRFEGPEGDVVTARHTFEKAWRTAPVGSVMFLTSDGATICHVYGEAVTSQRLHQRASAGAREEVRLSLLACGAKDVVLCTCDALTFSAPVPYLGHVPVADWLLDPFALAKHAPIPAWTKPSECPVCSADLVAEPELHIVRAQPEPPRKNFIARLLGGA